MRKINQIQILPQEEHKYMRVDLSHSDCVGFLLVACGLLFIIGAPALIWVFRENLTTLSPRILITQWYGAGGLLLLYFTAGLPLGAILIAAGGAQVFPASVPARRVLLPLLGIQLIYFSYHAIAVFRYNRVPFLLFAFIGFLFVILFLTLVWVWARKRPGLTPERQRVVDLQLGSGICFFTAAWQTCGLAGAPGFAIYPELVQKLDNQSFLIGQLVADHFFIAIGFVFLLLAVLAERSRDSNSDKQDNISDKET